MDDSTRLARLEYKMDLLVARLAAMEADTSRMGMHISFVEGVFEQVQRPFFAVMGAVDAALGRQQPARITTTAQKICGTVGEQDANEPVCL